MSTDPYRREVATAYEPTAVYPAAPVEPYVPGPVVWVPDAYGRLVPMPKHLAPPPVLATQPRDLTPVPLFDPRAQLVAAGGIGAGAAGAGIGWGIGQAAAGIAAFSGSSAVVVIALLLLAARLTGGSHGGDTITTVHNHNKWWGRSNTNA
jgi:hypothetical protein